MSHSHTFNCSYEDIEQFMCSMLCISDDPIPQYKKTNELHPRSGSLYELVLESYIDPRVSLYESLHVPPPCPAPLCEPLLEPHPRPTSQIDDEAFERAYNGYLSANKRMDDARMERFRKPMNRVLKYIQDMSFRNVKDKISKGWKNISIYECQFLLMHNDYRKYDDYGTLMRFNGHRIDHIIFNTRPDVFQILIDFFQNKFKKYNFKVRSYSILENGHRVFRVVLQPRLR